MNPRERADMVGGDAVEARLVEMLPTGSLAGGWIVSGGAGRGKATLAYRLARALLDPGALAGRGLDMPADARVFRLVAQNAHPDLFVAERRADPKTDKIESEIAVDTIRELIGFMGRTAAFGGWRVAVVDSADDLNLNSANALLKALEEPPPRATLLLLSTAPGRLLATIRSRCRRIALAPATEEDVGAFVSRETDVGPDRAAAAAAAAGGRPGYALALASDEGAEAVAAVETFLRVSAAGGDAAEVAAALSGKTGDARWEIFRRHLVERLADAARRRAVGSPDAAIGAAPAPAIAAAYHQITELLGRGEGLNADRAQLVLAAARTLSRALKEAA